MRNLHARDKDVTHSPSRVAMASASGDAQVCLSSRSPFICIRFLLPMDLVSYKIVLQSDLPKW